MRLRCARNEHVPERTALFEEAPFLAIVNGVHFDWDAPEASLAPEVTESAIWGMLMRWGERRQASQ